ncbi:MAG: prenyltransferase/squalene oxidase repeat-containing protein [Pirellulales bacterium]
MNEPSLFHSDVAQARTAGNRRGETTTRRQWLRFGCLATTFATLHGAVTDDRVLGQAPATAPSWLPNTPEAVERGLKFLAGQLAADNSFGSSEYDRQVSITSLAGMAFLSSGSTPDRGPLRSEMTRCVDYLIAGARPNGLIAEPLCADRLQMYGHGFSLLFLSEISGMARHADLRSVVSAAVRLTCDCQSSQGGWPYTPESIDSDVSVTACQLVALRAARNAGHAVDKAVVDRAYRFVRSCQNADGGFRYLAADGPSDFPRSAAALAAMYAAGDYDSDHVRRAIQYLAAQQDQFTSLGADSKGNLPTGQQYFHYGQYYAAQAWWQSGAEHWGPWFRLLQPTILRLQQPDGGWQSEFGRAYATAMSLIVLQIPNNLLPILQR